MKNVIFVCVNVAYNSKPIAFSYLKFYDFYYYK